MAVRYSSYESALDVLDCATYCVLHNLLFCQVVCAYSSGVVTILHSDKRTQEMSIFLFISIVLILGFIVVISDDGGC